MGIDDKYAEARITLDGAIAEFFKAAHDIGMSTLKLQVMCVTHYLMAVMEL